ncbi:unannotated protein [freshwater metagenome]|uniref:Unannotated protein n=1 Tax=freshwater metagenome TaxID=449393 RepID=A0A6J5YJJ3_9ZZZZ
MVRSVATIIFLAKNSPLFVITEPSRISSTRVFRCKVFTRLAIVAGSALTPSDGIPERPEIKLPMISLPTTALTRAGSARNTPCKKGFNTFWYRSAVPHRNKCASTLSSCKGVDVKYFKNNILEVNDPDLDEKTEKKLRRGSPRFTYLESNEIHTERGASLKFRSRSIPRRFTSG